MRTWPSTASDAEVDPIANPSKPHRRKALVGLHDVFFSSGLTKLSLSTSYLFHGTLTPPDWPLRLTGMIHHDLAMSTASRAFSNQQPQEDQVKIQKCHLSRISSICPRKVCSVSNKTWPCRSNRCGGLHPSESQCLPWPSCSTPSFGSKSALEDKQ